MTCRASTRCLQCIGHRTTCNVIMKTRFVSSRGIAVITSRAVRVTVSRQHFCTLQVQCWRGGGRECSVWSVLSSWLDDVCLMMALVLCKMRSYSCSRRCWSLPSMALYHSCCCMPPACKCCTRRWRSWTHRICCTTIMVNNAMGLSWIMLSTGQVHCLHHLHYLHHPSRHARRDYLMQLTADCGHYIYTCT